MDSMNSCRWELYNRILEKHQFLRKAPKERLTLAERLLNNALKKREDPAAFILNVIAPKDLCVAQYLNERYLMRKDAEAGTAVSGQIRELLKGDGALSDVEVQDPDACSRIAQQICTAALLSVREEDSPDPAKALLEKVMAAEELRGKVLPLIRTYIAMTPENQKTELALARFASGVLPDWKLNEFLNAIFCYRQVGMRLSGLLEQTVYDCFRRAFVVSAYAMCRNYIDFKPADEVEFVRKVRGDAAWTTDVDFFFRTRILEVMLFRLNGDDLQTLEQVCRISEEQADRISLEESDIHLRWLSVYCLCKAIQIDPDHMDDHLLQYPVLHGSDENDDSFPFIAALFRNNVQKQEQYSFETLYRRGPEGVLKFIRALGNLNFYHLRDDQYFPYYTGTGYVITNEDLELLTSKVSRQEAVEIYMNSPLRGQIRIERFLKALYQRNFRANPRGIISIRSDFMDHLLSGRVCRGIKGQFYAEIYNLFPGTNREDYMMKNIPGNRTVLRFQKDVVQRQKPLLEALSESGEQVQVMLTKANAQFIPAVDIVRYPSDKNKRIFQRFCQILEQTADTGILIYEQAEEIADPMTFFAAGTEVEPEFSLKFLNALAACRDRPFTITVLMDAYLKKNYLNAYDYYNERNGLTRFVELSEDDRVRIQKFWNQVMSFQISREQKVELYMNTVCRQVIPLYALYGILYGIKDDKKIELLKNYRFFAELGQYNEEHHLREAHPVTIFPDKGLFLVQPHSSFTYYRRELCAIVGRKSRKAFVIAPVRDLEQGENNDPGRRQFLSVLVSLSHEHKITEGSRQILSEPVEWAVKDLPALSEALMRAVHLRKRHSEELYELIHCIRNGNPWAAESDTPLQRYPISAGLRKILGATMHFAAYQTDLQTGMLVYFNTSLKEAFTVNEFIRQLLDSGKQLPDILLWMKRYPFLMCRMPSEQQQADSVRWEPAGIRSHHWKLEPDRSCLQEDTILCNVTDYDPQTGRITLMQKE